MKGVEKRSIGRRIEDKVVRKSNNRFQELYNIGQTITSEINMEALFGIVMDQTNKIMNTTNQNYNQNIIKTFRVDQGNAHVGPGTTV